MVEKGEESRGLNITRSKLNSRRHVVRTEKTIDLVGGVRGDASGSPVQQRTENNTWGKVSGQKTQGIARSRGGRLLRLNTNTKWGGGGWIMWGKNGSGWSLAKTKL